jgi:hypothetical protein
MDHPGMAGIVITLKQLLRECSPLQGGFPLKNKVGGAIAVGGGRNTGWNHPAATDHVHAFPGMLWYAWNPGDAGAAPCNPGR